MNTIFILHLQSESSQNYYYAFTSKPTEKEINDNKYAIYTIEYGSFPENDEHLELIQEVNIAESLLRKNDRTCV